MSSFPIHITIEDGFHNIWGFLECYCRSGKNQMGFKTTSRQEMIDHIEEHREKGDKVSDYAITRLKRETHEKEDAVT